MSSCSHDLVRVRWLPQVRRALDCITHDHLGFGFSKTRVAVSTVRTRAPRTHQRRPCCSNDRPGGAYFFMFLIVWR